MTKSPGRQPGDTGSLGEPVLPCGMEDGTSRHAESPGFRRGLCDCKCTEPAGCESLSVAGLAAVTERNCVPARGGGEHQEVND